MVEVIEKQVRLISLTWFKNLYFIFVDFTHYILASNVEWMSQMVVGLGLHLSKPLLTGPDDDTKCVWLILRWENIDFVSSNVFS